MKWLQDLWDRFIEWKLSWLPCNKELRGYRCQHRIMSNGERECGPDINYWRGA